MASITHAFVSTQTQGGNAALASKNEWNATHKVIYNVSVKSANYTPAVDGSGVIVDDVIVCSGTFTLTLPAATGSGKPLFIILSAAGTLTVARTGADTIGGTTGFAVSAVPACFFVLDQAAGAWGIHPDLDVAYSLKGNPTGVTALSQDIQKIILGTPAFTPAAVADQFTAASTTYYQSIVQNTSNSATASTDFIVENDLGTDSVHYADFGINSSAYTGTGALNLANAGYLYVQGGDLVIGTTSANGLHFFVNGGTTDAMSISSAGIVAIPNLLEGTTSTATAAGTTTLTATSNYFQLFTGSSAQTVVLPAVSTLSLGTSFCILNSSTGALTVNSSGGNLVAVVLPGGCLIVTCVLITGTTAASWNASGSGVGNQPRGTTTIAMAGGTTTLTASSTRQQIFTGSGTTAQTAVLPAANTLPFVGWEFEFDTASTGAGALTVQTNGAAQLFVIPPGCSVIVTCTSIGTTAGTWDVDYSGNVQPQGTQTISTAGSTTTMTVGFPRQTIFTGTNTQTVVLPDARTLPFVDWQYEIDNLSSRTLVIQTSGGTLLTTIAAGVVLYLNCTSLSTQAGTWQFVSPPQFGSILPSLPIVFPGLDVYGHSWDENPVNSSGGYGPALQINSNDFAGRIFANACGITGDRYVNHAVSSSQLTGIGAANGHFARLLADTFRSRQAFPFVRSGNATILGWGINDIGNNTAANQALVRSTAVDILTVLISTLRASVIYNANGGANLTYGGNFSNAAAAAADWTSGFAKQCTVVDSAGSSTVTFTIPVGYQGEPICFRLGGLQAGSLVVTWGGTAGITGTTTLSSRSINSNSTVPNRITTLTAANAGQTITCAVTTISGSTFYFDGVVIEAFKPMPVLVCNVPRLPQRTITWSSGAGVTTGVNTSFTDASIQFSGTGGIYDVGATLTEVDAQGALTGNTNTVASVTNATTIVLGSNAAAAKTSIKYTITRQLRGYSSSLYWTTNTNFTSATVASHAAADTDITNWNTQVVNGVVALFDSMVQVVDLDGAVGQDVGLPQSGVYTYWNVDGGHLTSAGQMKRAHAIWQAAANLVAATADSFNLINLQEQGAPSYYNAPYRRIIKSGQIILPDQAVVCPTTTLTYTAVAGDAFAFPFYTTEAAEYWGNVYMDQSNAGTSVLALGLYTDTGSVNGVSGYPQYLIKSTSNFTMSGATVNTVGSIGRPVYPGLVWLVVIVQSVGTASTFYTMYGAGSLLLPGWNGLHLGTTSYVLQPIAWKVTGVAAGTPPSIFPTGGTLAGAALSGLGNVAPLIGVQAYIQ